MNPIKSSQNPYFEQEGARAFLNYMNSQDGVVHRDTLAGYAITRLKQKLQPGAKILDAACGTGWLAQAAVDAGFAAEGCDISPLLLETARKNSPQIKFTQCDLNQTWPYLENIFDAVIISAGLLDFEDVDFCFREIHRVLKPGGIFICISPNPYYAFPVGQWKRGWLGKILGRKPQLQLKDFGGLVRQADKKFAWAAGQLTSRLLPLPVQINAATNAGLQLLFYQDILGQQDSPAYNLKYRLYRYPIFVLLEFKKAKL